MTAFSDAYTAWRGEPFPHGSSDAVADELHADVALADTWVAESVIPFFERRVFVPATVDVMGELRALQDRAEALIDRERAGAYLAYLDRLTDVYGAFLSEGA